MTKPTVSEGTEGSQLVFQIRLESHQHHSTILQ